MFGYLQAKKRAEMKDSLFQYALIVLAIILVCMLVASTIYIGTLQVENEVLTQENQELKETMDSISEEIGILSDRISEITKDVGDSEDWNREAF